MSLTHEQIVARRAGVGSSEILAALGKDSRCSRLELYKRKVGELPDPDFSDNERVLVGSVIEPAIRSLFEDKLGTSIVKFDDTLQHPSVPLVGHPDGIIESMDCGIEFKNRDWLIFRDEYGEDGTDQVPLRDLVQCVGYMELTGLRRWLVGVLVGGNERHLFEIHYDADLAAAIRFGVEAFWEYVKRMRPPPPETPEDVKLMWPKDLGTSIDATSEIETICAELALAKTELKAAEQRENELKAKVQRFMGENAVLVGSEGKPLATWKAPQDSLKFDAKQYQEDHPLLCDPYMRKVPNARRFLLKLK
ncbi:MAG: YqaJ viral recombinase family protein [Phycisphaerales bacterium]|nr:YqaJ viral recombinase family protein [Phycisphaerales bacterium]